MSIHLSGQQLVSMIIYYYKKFEEKDVTVRFTCGKVVNNKKYISSTSVVHFDVSEITMKGQKAQIHRIFLDKDSLDDIIAKVLRETGFETEEVIFVVDPLQPSIFKGISVTGSKIEMNNEVKQHI